MDTTHAPGQAPGLPMARPATAEQLRWLDGELRTWVDEGLIGPDQAGAVRGRYHTVATTRRFSLAKLLLSLGACFLGVGLIWLVAANLDELSPLMGFLVVTVLWLAALTGGELLHDRARRIPTPAIGAVRMVAALGFGAVVFQAAQSMQVPAFEPMLVGIWSLGALLHAYVARAGGPLLVGISTGLVWLLWQVGVEAQGALVFVLALAAAAVAAVSFGPLHRRLPTFATAWREVGVLLGLVTLFAAALPFVGVDDFAWSPWLVAAVVVAALLGVAATVVSAGRARLVPLGAVAVAAVAVLLVVWEAGDDAGPLTAQDWAHAAVSVGAYVALAVGVAVLGSLTDSWRLTALATLALVVFTTFQSFAVFAQVIQGAWLFVVLGLVFAATGLGFDRARRELVANLDDDNRATDQPEENR